MNKSSKKQPLLRIKFEGTAIRNNTILFDDLSTFVSNVSTAIDRLVQKLLQKDVSIKRGRPLKTIQVLSALEIVSMRKGSVKLSLDLRRNGQQFPGWDLGEQATDILVLGIDSLKKDKLLPKEYDHGILIALRDAGKIIERGIDKIGINSSSSFGTRKTLYTQPIREKVIARIRRFEQAYNIVEGRLLSADVKEDRLRCRIEPSIGDPISCTFDESMFEQVLRFMRQFVQARGEATYDVVTGKITLLNIRDMESIDESAAGEVTKVALSSFWRAKSFEELADEQGVYPVNDLSIITGGWPKDEDIDSFLNTIRSSRAN
jgi:hypothetical protein